MTDRPYLPNFVLPDHGDDESPLWQFALQLYSVPQVSAACLALQDNHGADVNMILLCSWVGRHGAYLPRQQIAILDQLVLPWRTEVIGPLRALRRQLKAPVGPVGPDRSGVFRETIKCAELQAEKIQLDVLFQALETLPAKNAIKADRGGVIRSNLLHYLAMRGVNSEEVTVRAFLETLVSETVALG